MRGPDRLAASAAAAVLALLVAVSWGGLWDDAPGGTLLFVTVAAAAPAAALAAPRHPRALCAAAAACAAVGTLAAAADVGAGALLTLDGDAWRAAADVIPEGVSAASHESLPLDAGAPPELGGLLVLLLGALLAAVVWQAAVRRRPVAAVALAGGGLGYRWTVVPPDRPALAGAVALVAALGALWLLRAPGAPGRRRGPGGLARAGAAAAALAVVAGGLAAGPARVDGAWWDWRSWDIGDGGPTRGIDLEQNYGQLDWGDRPVVMFRLTTPRPTSLRAAVFERFDGFRFAEQSAPGVAMSTSGDRFLTGDTPPDGADVFEQTVELTAGGSPWVLAGGRPLAVRAPGVAAMEILGGATLRPTPALTRGREYTVDTYLPDPGTRALLDTEPYAQVVTPAMPALTVPLDGGFATDVDVPAFGSGSAADPAAFGAYADVYRLSRRWIGDATTPFQAVNRIETRLRSGYAYDERPPAPAPGSTPLSDFLLVSKAGFCQQFAGAMALMLRMNGIPARVAVGFTTGRFDATAGRYDVLDRDAHSWVEVWFPRYGWLPFDPTPGRFAPNTASVSNPDYATPGGESLGIEEQPVRPPADAPADLRGPETTPPPAPGPVSGGDDGSRAWLWALLAAALAVAAAGAAPAARALARVRRRRRGDTRERVVSAVRELERELGHLGAAPHPSLTPTERAAAIRARVGVDASDLYRRAGEARFAAAAPGEDTVSWAWRESARLRRLARDAAPRRRSPLTRRRRPATRAGRRP